VASHSLTLLSSSASRVSASSTTSAGVPRIAPVQEQLDGPWATLPQAIAGDHVNGAGSRKWRSHDSTSATLTC
jgi:hypothetical protein